jgi:hypothetical protein
LEIGDVNDDDDVGCFPYRSDTFTVTDEGKAFLLDVTAQPSPPPHHASVHRVMPSLYRRLCFHSSDWYQKQLRGRVRFVIEFNNAPTK